ncbi:MAG: flagellin FliC [Myxococcales bacterium]|nr:flagellin FliC [Myxococcales bacterium]MCB9735012.1 flagellin FliC [Deltaproteobacteria bacterium]
MALMINTNQSSLSVQKTLAASNSMMQSSVGKLSSGMRINSAADDAAGLAVSEGLRAQTRGFKQASSNATQGVAMLQTADSAMQTMSDTLIRMRELAVQSASDGLTDTERAYVNTEFSALSTELTRISDVTEYNGQKLLDGTAGTAGTLTFQVGTRNTANDRITISMADTDATALGVNASAVDSLTNAQTAIDDIDAALDTLNTRRSGLGATVNQMSKAIDNLNSTVENLGVADGNIRDVDVAAESAQFSKSQVLQQAGVAMLAQANTAPQLALRLLS